MNVHVRLALGSDRACILNSDVFDAPARDIWVDAFLSDRRHHLLLALTSDGACIGFLSAVDQLHPDKAPQLWINELGVNAPYRRQGIGTALLKAALRHARKLGCTQAWVLSDPTNAALGFYESLDAIREGSDIAMFTFDLMARADG